ncbi:beta-N-acetylhexosaminidase, partial [Actinocrinis puniceicyclus]
ADRRLSRRLVVIILAVLAAAGIGLGTRLGTGVVGGSAAVPPPTAQQKADYAGIVPAPVHAAATGGQFTITSSTAVSVPADSIPARGVGDYLAALLRPSTGYPLAVGTSDGPGGGRIRLALTGASPDKQLGPEGYRLDVAGDQITATANEPAGLFHAVETLRQLLPPEVEQRSAQHDVSWTVPSGHVVDSPRFAYRAAGLDVARHFFGVADVERYIDEIALYKVDYLHLHLTDDQGWRLAIDGWPKLTGIGARTEVGGRAGGFYTQDDYRKLVAYAQARYVTIIPEIDVPGHVTAALASYPQLSCDGKPRPVFTGIDIGFSSLCAGKPTIYAFLADVIRQVAALTPGPYIGIGGDEAQATSAADYTKIVGQAAADVRADGKTPWGWQEITSASIGTPAVATYWSPGFPTAQLKRSAAAGTQLVLDPASHTYLDQKYDAATTLGLHWAGYVEVQDAYNWDPGTYLPGVDTSSVLGVEADLWTETVVFNFDIDYMAFPRLPAIAELGWSPWSTHDWSAFRLRLASQGPRWKALGVKYYRSPQVPWPPGG